MQRNLKYVAAGHFTSRENWIHPTTEISTWELIYMTEGEAYLFEGERELSLTVGDVALLRPGVTHGGTRESHGRVSFIWLHVMPSTDEAAAMLESLPSFAHCFESTELPMMLRQLLHKANLGISLPEACDLFSELILLEYKLFSGESTAASPGERLTWNAREWIRINSDRRLTVDTVAGRLGYNKDYLGRLFRRHAGVSLKEYIDSCRMNRLKSLLMTTDKTLSEIADEGDFDDVKAFLKFFSYHAGITPTDFRKSCYMTHSNNK